MPSPFPSMDPYLEAPYIWPDFHAALASEIRGFLNLTLPRPYYARLEMRPEIGLAEDENGETRHHLVEIRNGAIGHKLITMIEIVRPSNKHSGYDRRMYRKKQQELLSSDANLIEIDLLRSGDRLIAELNLLESIERLSPPPDYLVLVNRALRRDEPTHGFQTFPITVREMLPCFPVPLKQGEVEVPLDLQFVFNRAYDSGPYRRGAVDYRRPPDPPLRESETLWAAKLVESFA